MKRRKAIDLEERAAFYQVCTRTARRWHNSGADLHNPRSVAALLLKMRNPSPRALKTIHSIISTP
jgi:hypothetical protein